MAGFLRITQAVLTATLRKRPPLGLLVITKLTLRVKNFATKRLYVDDLPSCIKGFAAISDANKLIRLWWCKNIEFSLKLNNGILIDV